MLLEYLRVKELAYPLCYSFSVIANIEGVSTSYYCQGTKPQKPTEYVDLPEVLREMRLVR